jgi:FKBP-type peptidyl-prolyl cis-trans isomerase SlyD
MIAEKNKVVSLIYELTATKNEKELIEKTTEDRPLSFLFGHGSLLPKFESEISGKKTGDSFDFVLKSDDAYGGFNENAIINVPLKAFHVDGKVDSNLLQIGRNIPMMDQEGNRLSGVVVEIGADTVKMDFNHPLAGEDLHFKGSVVEIREATEEEMAHGHIHQQGGCSECGSKSEGCESGGCCG